MKFKLKNHVSPKVPTLNKVLQSQFGFSITDLDAALQGDQGKLKSIGEAARQGRITAEFMPLLEQACSNIIEGTAAYNVGTAKILAKGAKAAIQIDKASTQAILANQKYINDKAELKLDSQNQWKAEQARHQYQIDYIGLKSYIDFYITGVDNNARLIEQNNRPEIKQVGEDERYETLVAKELLTNGDAARTDLITRREYMTNSSSNRNESGFMRTIRQIKGALGF